MQIFKTMKKTGIFLLFMLFGLLSVSAQEKVPNAMFGKTVHDFGKIAEEIGKATCTFEFVNTGSAPLLINKVGTSCGCTTPSYTKDPILPGEKGEIKVQYSTTGRVGAFEKSINVFTNVPDTTYKLTIKGEVLPKK